jgi:Holliday junction resolvase RusA-like endonuclease
MPTFRLPLPPSSNHGYKLALHGGHPALVKTLELERWESAAAAVLGPWRAPARVPLKVSIALVYPAGDLRRYDLDGPIKFLIDALVSRRRDQWVDELTVCKIAGGGEGHADVEVETIDRSLEATIPVAEAMS